MEARFIFAFTLRYSFCAYFAVKIKIQNTVVTIWFLSVQVTTGSNIAQLWANEKCDLGKINQNSRIIVCLLNWLSGICEAKMRSKRFHLKMVYQFLRTFRLASGHSMVYALFSLASRIKEFPELTDALPCWIGFRQVLKTVYCIEVLVVSYSR